MAYPYEISCLITGSRRVNFKKKILPLVRHRCE